MRSRRDFLSTGAGFVAGAASTGIASAATPAVALLNGQGPQSSGLGVAGDFYIDDRAHAVYGPKRTSGWGRSTSLVGPRGGAGSSGPEGPDRRTRVRRGNRRSGRPGSGRLLRTARLRAARSHARRRQRLLHRYGHDPAVRTQAGGHVGLARIDDGRREHRLPRRRQQRDPAVPGQRPPSGQPPIPPWRRANRASKQIRDVSRSATERAPWDSLRAWILDDGAGRPWQRFPVRW